MALILGLDPVLFLVLIIIFMPIIFFFVLIMIDMTTNKKARMLYFETEKLARIIDANIKDGFAQIRKKKFFVQEVKPVFIPSGIIVKSWRPLYAIRWDKVIPFQFVKEGLKAIPSAENMKNLIENKTLDALLKPASTNKQALLFFIMGAVMGGLIGYVISISLK